MRTKNRRDNAAASVDNVLPVNVKKALRIGDHRIPKIRWRPAHDRRHRSDIINVCIWPPHAKAATNIVQVDPIDMRKFPM